MPSLVLLPTWPAADLTVLDCIETQGGKVGGRKRERELVSGRGSEITA